VPSKNGFYVPSDEHQNIWAVIKQLHFEFISKTAAKYKKLRKGTQNNSKLLMEYIRGEIGDFFPSSDSDDVGGNTPPSPSTYDPFAA
jgi:hypothetical protein